MNNHKLDMMTKGWFIGAFSPSAFKTDVCEVAIKFYSQGESEPTHYHKIANEVTAVVFGKILMCNNIYSKGDIISLSPGERTSFYALEESCTVVVKLPGALNDKYAD